MGQKNPEKRLGNTGNCYKCNGAIVCGEGYEKKPTWQNSDGKSHYSQDGSCKGGRMQGSTSSVPQVDLSNFKPELVTPEEIVIWNDIVMKVAEYAILAQKTLGDYNEIQNPALKGLVTKISFEVLSKIKERQLADA